MSSLYIPDFSEMLAVSHSHGANSEAPDSWKDLVGLWPMGAGGGPTAYNLSGYDNHGTLINGPTWVPTEKGWGLDFDGSNEHITVPAVAGAAFLTLAGSVAFWAKLSPMAGIYVALGYGDTGSDYWLMRPRTRAGTQMLDIGWDIGAGDKYRRYNHTWSGEWVFIVVTYDGTLMRAYFDGVEKAVDASDGNGAWLGAASPPDVRIIFGNDETFNYDYLGQMGSIALYLRALALAEIQQLYERPNDMLTLRRKVYAAAVAPGFVPYPYPRHELSGGLAT